MKRTDKLMSVLFVLVAYVLWDSFTPVSEPVGQWVEARPSGPVAAVQKEVIHPKALKVYTKPAKAKLNLPATLQQDDNQYVLASSTLKHDYHPQTVTTLVNRETGEATTITRGEPYPWLAAQQTGEIRLDYGIKNGGVAVGRLTLREDLLQVKGVNLGAGASLDTDGAVFVGAGVGFKW